MKFPQAHNTIISRHWYKTVVKKGIIISIATIIYALNACGLSRNSNHHIPNETTESPLLHVQVPSWDKFIRVIATTARAYKEPNNISPYLMVESYNFETDAFEGNYLWADELPTNGMETEEYVINSGSIMPLLGEQGDFYKVYISDESTGAIVGYIKKEKCQEIMSSPITTNIAVATLSEDDSSYFVDKGSGKGLCFNFTTNDLYGDDFCMGELMDGNRLIFPTIAHIGTYPDTDHHGPITLKKDEQDYYSIVFNKESMKQPNPSDPNFWVFDANKMNDKLANEIYESIDCSKTTSMTIYYYFPKHEESLYPIYYVVEKDTATNVTSPVSASSD